MGNHLPLLPLQDLQNPNPGSKKHHATSIHQGDHHESLIYELGIAPTAEAPLLGGINRPRMGDFDETPPRLGDGPL